VIEDWWPAHVPIGFGKYEARQQFAPTYFGDTFLLLAVAVIMALAPLPAALLWLREKLKALFTLPALVLVGRDSIRMYLIHVYFVYVFEFALRHHLAPGEPVALYMIVFVIIAGFIATPWVLGRVDGFIHSRAWPLRASRSPY
jgi:peptidoglycan/LPS O-acetylase OafA/YrhL